MQHLIFRDILIIFLASIPVILLLKKLHLPPLVGFILTGSLLGPSGLGLIPTSDRVEVLAQIGVTLLLFSVGLEFSLENLAKLRTYVLYGGALQIFGCLAGGLIVGTAFEWPLPQGIFFGCLIALSSTAVVLASLMDNRLQETLSGRITTGILILQDLAVIPMLVFLPWMLPGAETGGLWSLLLWNLGRILLVFGPVFFFIRYLSGPVLRTISSSRSRELFLITVISFTLGMAWLTHSLGISFALGAFLGGLMIGGTDYQTEALSEIAPFRYAFNSIFFVSIGMLLDYRFLAHHLPIVLAMAIAIPSLKVAVTSGSLILVRAPHRLSINVGILLGQIGEFSFLLASMGKSLGAFDRVFYQYFLAIASVTMILTPLFVRWAAPLAERIARLPGLNRISRTADEKELDARAPALKDHVILSGFGPLGSAISHFLEQYKIPYLILELNPETIERRRATRQNIFFGDGTSEEILFRSGIERARLLVVTIPGFLDNVASVRQARRLNPKITIITRAKYRREVSELYEAGADIVVSEELEGGIEMGRMTLEALGFPPDEVDSHIQKIREFGSADFF